MNFFRILCVDDNSSFLLTLKLGLRRYGFEVITATHGIDALMQYKSHSGDFGAIVTDNDMPEMNGFEFVRSVRAMGFAGRIVVMSGNLTSDNLWAFQKCKINGFFTKPFDIDMLATMLLQTTPESGGDE